MLDERDETIGRIADALKPMPKVDPSAKARVLVAVAAERERVRERAAQRPRRRVQWSVTGIGLAAAAVIATVWTQAVSDRRVATPVPTTAASVAQAPRVAHPEGAQATPAARDLAASSALHSVQLVLRAPGARSVSVVGDFTGWDPDSAVMTRDSASGLWSVRLALRPGRHVYAFLVDDSIWVRDPRAPAAPDADFGRPGSVLFVGRP